MRSSKRFQTAAAVLVAASLSLTACSAGSSAGTTNKSEAKNSLTVALTGEPSNLDFTKTAGAAIPQALMANIYEGLVKIDQEGKIQPGLAESWTLSEDRKSYTFALRKDVKFSNGEAFTAADVKFSLERVKSAWVSSLKKKMDVVDAVNVVNDTEVTVVLSRPSNAWLFDLGTPVGAMFDPSGVADLANTAIGTGPFTIESWKRGEAIKMAARDGYWGTAPKVKTVTLRYFADATATTNEIGRAHV